jgi:hypothetical protein
LAAIIAGIVQSKSCRLPASARKIPLPAKAESRIKQISRWTKNDHINLNEYYLPFVQELLSYLASHGDMTFVIDGSEVGHHCIALMVSLIYKKRALPITWLMVEGAKRRLPEKLHLQMFDHSMASDFWKLYKTPVGDMCVERLRMHKYLSQACNFH